MDEQILIRRFLYLPGPCFALKSVYKLVACATISPYLFFFFFFLPISTRNFFCIFIFFICSKDPWLVRTTYKHFNLVCLTSINPV
ncbi:hypothetical protein HanRHA438_Chr15g0724971 [Helianthus annuus]|nr:hypothetical protein HanRHA438_Chr15g0724971 [Helianthus annuus]